MAHKIIISCYKHCLPLNLASQKHTHKSSALVSQSVFPALIWLTTEQQALYTEIYREDRQILTAVNVFKKPCKGGEGASTSQERHLRTRGVTELLSHLWHGRQLIPETCRLSELFPIDEWANEETWHYFLCRSVLAHMTGQLLFVIGPKKSILKFFWSHRTYGVFFRLQSLICT